MSFFANMAVIGGYKDTQRIKNRAAHRRSSSNVAQVYEMEVCWHDPHRYRYGQVFLGGGGVDWLRTVVMNVSQVDVASRAVVL